MTIRAASSRLLRETSGTTLALVAAAISALIGFTGLALEQAHMYEHSLGRIAASGLFHIPTVLRAPIAYLLTADDEGSSPARGRQ
jgi:hypothetical protein